MKIERTSENQIRCTLNKHDLMERQLKISELAYGSDKAKELFRDIMEQANIDLGFDADDIPLMIEAIPTSRDSIILLINKVDNPDELDEADVKSVRNYNFARPSKFSKDHLRTLEIIFENYGRLLSTNLPAYLRKTVQVDECGSKCVLGVLECIVQSCASRSG